MLKTSTIAGGVICAALFAAPAHAQPEPDSEAKPAAGATADGEGAQLTLPKGRLLLVAFQETNLSSGAVFKPVSISPDVWYGVTDDITAGLVHSAVGMTGVIGGTGTSLCLTGSDNLCRSFYPNVGFAARYKLQNGPLSYAAAGGLFVLDTNDPLLVGLKAGGVARWQKDKLAIEAEPSLYLGVTNRSVETAGVSATVNRDVLTLPATGLFAINPKLTATGQVALTLPIEDAGDFYTVSLSAGGHYRLNDSITVTAALSFPKLLANGGGIDSRTLTLGGTYAF
jgi:hypothetical protein